MHACQLHDVFYSIHACLMHTAFVQHASCVPVTDGLRSCLRSCRQEHEEADGGVWVYLLMPGG